VGIATPLVKNAGTTALMTAVVGVVVYVGAYGSVWLLKFVYLDRVLFRPQPAKLSPHPVSPPIPQSVQERV
jgi:hypothetical protein